MPPEKQPPATETTSQPSWIAPVMPVVPDHELVKRIGGGSYGDVWLARNVVGTWRAVKVVFRDRFTDARPYEREFSGMKKFEPLSRSNEGFIDILQIGRNDEAGYFYYVMELADDAAGCPLTPSLAPSGGEGGRRAGEGAATLLNPSNYVPMTLAKALLQRGRLPVNECLELGITLNLALGHLHRAGLIHRDIKPSNIIFVGGVPKLADIGLVIETSEARSYVGTEGFIPPEGPNSPQADLYSLGKVLYEAGMGKDRKDFPEPFTQIAETPDVGELLEFNAILLNACAANVAERYRSAEEMNADLALLQSGGSVRDQRKLARQLRFVRRAGVVVTALAAVIALGWWWQARQTKTVRRLAQEKEHERKLAEENLYLADMRVAYHHWESGQIAGMLDLLRRHIPRPSEPDRRGWEWFYLLSLCHRDERTLRGHTADVLAVSCDPAGRRFASVSYDHTLRVWDAESGASLLELKGHEDAVICVAWSPDGAWLASGGGDGKLILWDAKAFKERFVLDCEGEVWSLAWSSDGKRIAAGGIGHLPPELTGLVTVWDVTSGRQVQRLDGHVTHIRALAWQPGGNLLVAGENYPGKIQVWDANNGQLLHTIKAHDHFVASVAWRPDGRLLASASADNSVRIWDAETWNPLTTIDSAHNGAANALAWSEDGKRLVSGGNDGLVKVWNPETGILENTLRGHQASVLSVIWWKGHERVLSGGKDRTLRIWNPEIDQARYTFPASHVCAWSPDSRQIAVGTRRENAIASTIKILDAATWQTLFVLPGATNSDPFSVAWSPDARRLAAGFSDSVGLVQVWDIATREEVLTLDRAHKGDVRSVAWSPDGRRLATAGGDAAVRVWNIDTKENILTFLEHSNLVNSAVWSPDGRRIASKDHWGGVLIWDSSNGLVIYKLRCPAGFSAGKQYDVSWNTQGDKLAAAGADGTVMVWDSATGREIQALKGHTSVVRSVDWSPNGRRLVSGSEDRTIRIWDPESGRELLVLPIAASTVPSVAWSPSGRMISAAGRSHMIFDATSGYEHSPHLAHEGANQ